MKFSCVVGIDEAGRGALAGPLAVGAVCVNQGGETRVKRTLSGIRDSKKLTAKMREEWRQTLENMRQDNLLNFHVALISAEIVDTVGITHAAEQAVTETLRTLETPAPSSRILLDFGLSAPDTFTHQTQLVRGDESEPCIAAASILAKTARDAAMRRFAAQFPEYDFHIHKGYGTARHLAILKTHGACPIHRRSFRPVSDLHSKR